jgi:hypothetical protein
MPSPDTVAVILMTHMFGITRQAEAYISPHEASQRYMSRMAFHHVPPGSWIHTAFELLTSEDYVQGVLLDLRSWKDMNASGATLHCGLLHDLHVPTRIAPRPEWYKHLEDQTEWWRCPLLFARTQRNDRLTLQLSYRPIGRIQ